MTIFVAAAINLLLMGVVWLKAPGSERRQDAEISEREGASAFTRGPLHCHLLCSFRRVGNDLRGCLDSSALDDHWIQHLRIHYHAFHFPDRDFHW